MIELRTLGRVDLRGPDGRELRSILTSPKRLALLAYLALKNPPGHQRRDALLGLFWPELDQDRARNSLRNALSILRRELGPGVLISRGDEEVGLDAGCFWCDAVAFERALASGDLEEGLGLYRGDLLEGFFVAATPEFEHWLEARRTGLRERAAEAAWKLAERQEAEGNVAGAGHWARRAAAFAPYDEELQRRLIELLNRVGDRSGAIVAYELFAQRLAADLELEPTRQTQALIAAVRGETLPGAGGPSRSPDDSRPRRSQPTEPAVTQPAARPVASTRMDLAAGRDTVGSPASAPTDAHPRRPIRARRRSVLLGGAALSLGLGLTGLYFVSHPGHPGPHPVEASGAGPTPTIAILPFNVHGSGLEVWREGMVDVLSTNLDGVGGLHAVSSRTVLARWREGTRERSTPDLPTVLDVAQRAGARYALVGDAVSAGSRLRLTATLYDVGSGRSLGAEQVEGSPDSVFGLVDRLSIQVLRTIPNLDADELGRVNLARATTTSGPALKAYLEGERLFRHSDFKGAAAAYRRAVEADSSFALPLWRLGSYLTFAGDWAVASRARLESLTSRLPPREALLVRADLAFRQDEPDPPSASHLADGLSLLKTAARDYPDDPDIWYQLGETYWHRRGAIPPGPDEARREANRAFARAVELDPGFAPAYVHLINDAFAFYADSSRAARLIAAYGRVASGDAFDRQNRVAFGLAFGDSALRSHAISALDTLDAGALSEIGWTDLSHPNLKAAQQLVVQAVLERAASAPQDEWLALMAFGINLDRGQLRAALEHAPEVPDIYREFSLYVIYVTGLTELPPDAQRVLAVDARVDRSGDSELHAHDFYAGAYAADQARWSAYETALAHLRTQAGGARTSGGAGTGTTDAGTSAMALEGYGLWRRGQPDRALALLESARRRLPPGNRSGLVRLWLGKLLLEMGRADQAAPYLVTPGDFLGVPTKYWLAKAYEAQGQYETARQAYADVALAWSDADPELRPQVEESRAAAARLAKLIRE